MAKLETKSSSITLPKYIWNELNEDYKAQRLNTISDLILKYIKEGKAREDTLPLHLKIANAKDALSIRVDSILMTQNCVCMGSLVHKINSSIALSTLYGVASTTRNTKNSYEVSIFEVIQDLEQIDIEEYTQIKAEMRKYQAFHKRYLKYVQILSGQRTL